MPADPAVLSAVASPRRQAILRLLWNGEQPAGVVNAAMSDITFGAVSLQLRVLERAGLVAVRREGRLRLYRARRDRLGDVAQLLEAMWADSLWNLKLEAELEAGRRGPRPRRRPKEKTR